MDELTQRETRVIESLLENEALTANLDDEAAQALLDWGIAYGKQVARSTAGLSEAEAEAVLDEKLQAIRRLLRLVNQHADPAQHATESAARQTAVARLLQQAVDQVAIIEGEPFDRPDSEQVAAVAARWADQKLTQRALIEQVRQFVEQQRVPGAGERQTGQDAGAGEGSPHRPPATPAPEPASHPVAAARSTLQSRLLARLRALVRPFLP